MELADDIYVANIDRRSIVLDLNRDRYIGLSGRLSTSLHELLVPNNDYYIESNDLVRARQKLFVHGLLTDRAKAKFRNLEASATAMEPTESLWAPLPDERTSDLGISLASMISAFISLTQVAVSLRFQSFKSTIHWFASTQAAAKRRRANWSTQTHRRAQVLLRSYDEIRPYFPLKPICRLDALSLCLHLRRNGIHAQLVFGVRLDPFAAHCWVQIDDVVVSEAWSIVKQYTPILVV